MIKSKDNNANFFKTLVIVAIIIFILFAFGCCMYKIVHRPVNVKLKFTPEQQTVINALNQARDEEIKAKNDLEDAIQQAQTVSPPVDTNAVTTTWLENDPNVHITAGGKNIMIGYRSDGFITWKSQ